MDDAGCVPTVWKEALKGTPDGLMLDNMTQDEIDDAFSGNISFGTGGLRGVMGLGTNRINRYTITRVTQGLAKTVLSSDAPKSVGVAFDTRHNSAGFAGIVCETLAAFGIDVYTFDRPMPTPVLSHAISLLGLGWGVVITASHNPQEYNGCKVYDRHGVQLTDNQAALVMEAINTVEFFEPIPTRQQTSVKLFGKEVEEAYLKQIISFVNTDVTTIPPHHSEERSDVTARPFKLVYSALHGAGANMIPTVFKRLGFAPTCIQLEPDGAFGGLKTPNPEEPVVYEKSLEIAEKIGAQLQLATDPDGDRVGVMVKTGHGFVLLNGNQIGALLIDYLAQTRGVSKGDTVISTVVSGTLGEAVAEGYGLNFIRLLTGFKYIGEHIVNMPKDRRFFMGYEESYGYLAGSGAKDKDAVMASALIVKMAEFYAAKGKNLQDRWFELSEKHGYHLENLHSASASLSKQNEIMEILRGKPLIDGVIKVDDYARGLNGLPPADVIKLYYDCSFACDDNAATLCGAWAAIRPSGTEPKIKVYTGVHAKTQIVAEKALRSLTDTLLSKLGL